ncbi:carboxypeptidase-like regulatory domain-containing protein [Sphingobacterium sp. FBM7-1]|uniref:carboxypeptidase-like regulatory domain-containing protein n=1 Tax=Sphingobacterium sp. FBM7-1 TaxID=2886688 RepID=UPI001D12CA41|nr:carboxypeptidase-like regulatory domain-containing protein [Sphingobacterium sp. FBM7-1]MCC2597963.1 carboxypeptidase-like regulatory domain-containing protein [Sphingobacterium sp. FBM7-1]
MHNLFLAVLFSLGLSLSVKAQEIKGIVHELESSQRLSGVTVKNLRTGQATQTDADGNFLISGNINDYISFTQPGYEVDTAFVYQEGVQRIYLVRDSKTIVIDEVIISKLTDSRLAYEIAKAKNEGQVAEVSQSRGGIRLSLSRLFGRKSKLARKNLDLLLEEQHNRKIDHLFSPQVIRAVIPLTDTEMALFREQFRPSLEFIQTASPEDVRAYVLDSYSKFKNHK